MYLKELIDVVAEGTDCRICRMPCAKETPLEQLVVAKVEVYGGQLAVNGGDTNYISYLKVYCK